MGGELRSAEVVLEPKDEDVSNQNETFDLRECDIVLSKYRSPLKKSFYLPNDYRYTRPRLSSIFRIFCMSFLKFLFRTTKNS